MRTIESIMNTINGRREEQTKLSKSDIAHEANKALEQAWYLLLQLDKKDPEIRKARLAIMDASRHIANKEWRDAE